MTSSSATPVGVVHVVLVRWKPDVSPATVEELAELVDAFPAAIPGVLDVRYGPNSSPEGLGGGFDWAAVVSFTSSSARDDYLPHPAHVPVGELISQWSEQVVVFDLGG